MDKIKQRVESLRSEILALTEVEELSDAQSARWTEANAEFDIARAELAAAEERAARIDEVRSFATKPAVTGGKIEAGSAPAVIVRSDPQSVLEDRSLTGRERTRALADALLRSNEDKAPESSADQAHFEKLVKRHAADHKWAENMLARSSDVYADAFSKVVSGQAMLLDNEERAAVAIGTTTQGGYLVPTHLDPSIMLTNSGSTNALRSAGTRKVTLTEGNVWYGVTSAGSTASWDAELTAVSDDSPSVGTASITLYQAQAFVQASIQAFQDIAGLQSDVLTILADAKDRLEGAAFMTGSGSAPQGLFTVINASSSLKTTSTTAATIGEVDLHALYRALPIRWRGNGTFVANPLYTLAVKRLGTAVSSSYQGDFTQPVSERWLGRPVLESDDAPTTQTTTALDQEIVFADLGQFIIADKPGGMSVEFVPLMMDQATGLPNGARGWYAHWRTGSGMPNLAAGRVLVDKTSA